MKKSELAEFIKSTAKENNLSITTVRNIIKGLSGCDTEKLDTEFTRLITKAKETKSKRQNKALKQSFIFANSYLVNDFLMPKFRWLKCELNYSTANVYKIIKHEKDSYSQSVYVTTQEDYTKDVFNGLTW